MFFKLHKEGKIGYKKLTNADLGRGTSHQTHIGLYGDIFTFLNDSEVEEQSMLIYNNNADLVDCYFDRIENPDGTFRSPKIRKGDKNAVSVVTIIWDKVNEIDNDINWYLIWFGLQNERMVYYFFHENSADYVEVTKIIDLNKSGRIEEKSEKYSDLITYLENKVNRSNQDLIEELEIISQIGSSKRIKPFDLENAQRIFKETGQLGEKLIERYLQAQKESKKIFNYTWYNKNEESGLPYDFTVQTKSNNIVYIDVKTTKYKFEQPIVFSNQEVEFISTKPNYNIFRVFDVIELGKPKLKICESGKKFADSINPHISTFKNSLKSDSVTLQSAKMALSPKIKILSFGQEIPLE